MINGLIITHGELAKEMIRVVEMIMGPQKGLVGLSNDGLSLAELTARIEAWFVEHGEPGNGALLFVDDFGGSCARAAQFAAAKGVPHRILTGINLAMLLDFMTWREGLDLDDLARRLVEKGREAVSVVKPGRDAPA